MEKNFANGVYKAALEYLPISRIYVVFWRPMLPEYEQNSREELANKAFIELDDKCPTKRDKGRIVSQLKLTSQILQN